MKPTFGSGHAGASRAILAGVSIGATLAEARHQAGLTVADVSARTFIGESLIQAIEQDQFLRCGGDVYARGHIRAIAAVVATDPEALIGEYDVAHAYGGPATLDDVLRPMSPVPASPVPAAPAAPSPVPPGRRRHGWLVPLAMLGCLVVVVFIAYQLTGTAGPRQPDAASSRRPAAPAHVSSHGSRPRPVRAGQPAQEPVPPPAPAAVPVTEVTPVSAAAFGPDGTSDGDNPQIASLALSGDPATPWLSDWYTTPRFGNLQAGTGLLLDLGRTVTATNVTIALDTPPGADVRISAGTSPAGLRAAASAADAGGTVRLRLAAHPRVRYLLVWFTLLPPDQAGTYQAAVSGVTVTATTQ